MKHIASILLFGALLQSCGEHRNNEVSSKTLQTSPPMARVQTTTAVVPAKNSGKSAMKNDVVSTGQAAPAIKAPKKAIRAMTFNEAQFSDDVNDYPSTAEAQKLEKEKYE